jgi:hypothetical protein
MPEVIANTSPIQYLFQLGLLDLLPDLYEHITIPQAVCEEIDRGRMLGVSLPDLSALSWARHRHSSRLVPVFLDQWTRPRGVASHCTC